MSDAAVAEPQEKKKRHTRWGLIVPIAIFLAAALGWAIYWHVIKANAESGFAAVLAAERAAGAEADGDLVRAWGFPRELALELENLAYAPPDRAWRATAAHARVNINPSNPRHLIIEFDSPIEFAFPDRAPATLNADNLRLSVRTNPDGALIDAGVEAQNVSYADPVPNGRGFTAARIVANIRPAPDDAARHQLALDIETLGLERPIPPFEDFGRTIADLNLRIALTHAETLLAPPRVHLIDAWRQAGGVARLDGVRINWGALKLTAQGEALIDAAHRPTGRATLTLAEPGPPLLAAAGEAALETRNGALLLNGANIRALDPMY